MDRATYWATKSPLPEYHGVTFSHPAFDAPIRLVANQFEEVSLGGQVFTPVQMTVKQPDKTSDAQPKLTLGFARQVVGREFKRQLAKVRAATVPSPISVDYELYLGDTDAPQVTWAMYAAEKGGVSFSDDTVQVQATIDNPLRRDCAPIYDPSVFTGLELL